MSVLIIYGLLGNELLMCCSTLNFLTLKNTLFTAIVHNDSFNTFIQLFCHRKIVSHDLPAGIYMKYHLSNTYSSK